jgi:hypothetical protein
MSIALIMAFRCNNRRLLVPSVLCLLFLASCVGNKRVSTVVYEEKNRSVSLESRLAEDKKPINFGYQHPATLTQEDLERILSSIYIKRHKTLLGLLIPMLRNKDREPAFTLDEIQFLSQHLPEALAEAKPDQRVTFLLKRPRGMSRREITSGALFIREGQLYFILANDRTMLDQENNRTIADENDPLDVLDPSAFEILPGEHQKLIPADQKIQDRENALPKTWLVIDYQAMQSSQPTAEPPSASGPSLQTSPQNPSSEPKSASPLEEKLRLLKRLREQGLISEEEYQAKKKELLQEF